MTIETHLTKIAFELCQAEAHLALIRAKLADLEQAGIYPALPTERWKDDRYLYLYFPNGAPGLHLDAKQRLYIGADSARIGEARRLVANRRRWEELSRIAKYLSGWIINKETGIKQMAGQANQWPQAEAKLLGLEIAAAPGAPIPKLHPKLVEGPHPDPRPATEGSVEGRGLGTDIRVGDAERIPNEVL